MRKFVGLGFMIVLLGFLTGCNKKDIEIQIIPEPASISFLGGQSRMSSFVSVSLGSDDADLKLAAEYLKERLSVSTGMDIDIRVNSSKGKSISLLLETLEFSDNPDAYKLIVTKKGVNIKGNSARAVFYGVQTLMQLMPPEIFGNEKTLEPGQILIPRVEIRDEPRYSWRGMHLDVGRHIFPVEFIKKYIDLIAMHKMNVFHWHLTEDQGWRIEIKKYPLLTEIGSQRKTADGGTYGGFYTQEQIKEVVEYARTRFVDVMPEIELPGHSVAALAGYPELSCTGGPFEVRQVWGVAADVYCAGKEETFEFLENVLSEVIELFPFEYFHIGGDECPKTRWKDCPDCQKRIRDEGLADEHELQSWFIRRIEKFLITKDRRLVGWDEILEGGLAPEATVMSWRGVKGGIQAARESHDVIMSPTSHCYFDFYQGDPVHEPKAIGGYLTMEKVYSFEPAPDALNAEEAKHILGAQGNVWTEYISTTEQVEYMAVPRMSALAEVVWSPASNRDYELFLYRMNAHYLRLEEMNVNYRIPTPVVSANNFVFLKDFTLELHKTLDGARILYSTDGSDPSESGQEYTEPLVFTEDAHIKALTMMSSDHISSIMEINLDQQDIVNGLELERQSGVSYTLYNGRFKSVYDFKELKSNDHGTVSEVGFPDDLPKGSYGLVEKGYILIERAGIYRFYTFSDDGTALIIRGQEVVSNDGLHGGKEMSGEIALGQGWHPFELRYFQAGGGSSLELEYSGPGVEKQSIKEENLASYTSPMKMIRMN